METQAEFQPVRAMKARERLELDPTSGGTGESPLRRELQ